MEHEKPRWRRPGIVDESALRADADKCGRCIDAVIADARKLNESEGWRIGADARRHWAAYGRGVCGVPTLPLRVDHED